MNRKPMQPHPKIFSFIGLVLIIGGATILDGFTTWHTYLGIFIMVFGISFIRAGAQDEMVLNRRKKVGALPPSEHPRSDNENIGITEIK